MVIPIAQFTVRITGPDKSFTVILQSEDLFVVEKSCWLHINNVEHKHLISVRNCSQTAGVMLELVDLSLFYLVRLIYSTHKVLWENCGSKPRKTIKTTRQFSTLEILHRVIKKKLKNKEQSWGFVFLLEKIYKFKTLRRKSYSGLGLTPSAKIPRAILTFYVFFLINWCFLRKDFERLHISKYTMF